MTHAPGGRLAERRLEPEAMDAPDLPADVHDRALDGLARLNRWSFAPAALWKAVRPLARASAAPLELLDVACGAGDLPVALALRARRAGLALRVTGCDRSATALEHGRALAARHGVDVAWRRVDAVAGPLPPADVVSCSLFLHHLDERDARTLLAGLAAAARRLVLLVDLRRSRAGLALATVATRLASRSPVVHRDGPASVRAAFTPDELSALAAAAGLSGARVQTCFPQRMMLTWSRSGT